MRSSLILWLARNRQQIVVTIALLVGVSTAHASTSPTPTPTPPALGACVPIPCGGDCAMPAPCTPGTACPQYVVKGTCEVVSNTCACVTNSLTPVPTPTFGGCGLSCDDRPCVAQCADGSVVQGFCTNLTVDRGCACTFGCGSPPTPTPTRFAVCTPPPCRTGEVFYCPASCPGGCGAICATPTKSPAITPTPNARTVSDAQPMQPVNERLPGWKTVLLLLRELGVHAAVSTLLCASLFGADSSTVRQPDTHTDGCCCMHWRLQR